LPLFAFALNLTFHFKCQHTNLEETIYWKHNFRSWTSKRCYMYPANYHFVY